MGLDSGKSNATLREERWSDVLKECEKIKKQDDSGDYEEDINLAMGIAYIGEANLEKAFACFKKAPNSELAHVFLRNIYTCVMNLEGEERELQILKEEYGSTIALWDKDLRRIAEAVSCADDKIVDKIRHY